MPMDNPVTIVLTLFVLHYVKGSHARFKEMPLPNATVVYGSEVTCQNPPDSNMVYESRTWSCQDIKIDGYHLRYWYWVPDHHCTDAPDDYDAGADANDNDVAALCRALLASNRIDGQLRAAFIHDPSCKFSVDARIILSRNPNATGGFDWRLFKPGRGYARTLRCMLHES